MAQAATPGTPESHERLPQVAEIINGERTRKKYRLLSQIGDGGYGIVFEATDEVRKVAVKTEKYSKSMLHIEINVLKTAGMAKCKHILELIDYGVQRPDYCYVVMPLLGKDVHQLRNDQKERKFSFGTAVRLGKQGIQALHELHDKCGFLSRDIKPGNFACGHPKSNERRTIFLIDFGLARKYRDKNRNIIATRKEVGWRGTTRYGSLQAHLKQDLGRKDDVESWFYMLVEITKGALPWRSMNERSAVHAAKLSGRTQTRSVFLGECPPEYDQVLIHIDSLSFPDEPKYDLILQLLQTAQDRAQIPEDCSYDWEDESTLSSTKNSSHSDHDHNANANNSLFQGL